MEIPSVKPIKAPEVARAVMHNNEAPGIPGALVTVEPTQVRRPWRATLRTLVQVGIPAILAAGLVVPQIVQAILDEAGKQDIVIPDSLRLALLGVSAAVVFVSAALARIMAIPQVEMLLRKIGLGAAPK